LLKIKLRHADGTVAELMVPPKSILVDVVLFRGKVFSNSGMIEAEDAATWFHENPNVYDVDAMVFPASDLIEASRVSFAESQLEALRDLFETDGARVREGLQKAIDAIDRHKAAALEHGSPVALGDQALVDIDQLGRMLTERRDNAGKIADNVLKFVMRAWRDACGMSSKDGCEWVAVGTCDRFEAGLKAMKKLRGRIVRELMR
jgi:hypothetical protein